MTNVKCLSNGLLLTHLNAKHDKQTDTRTDGRIDYRMDRHGITHNKIEDILDNTCIILIQQQEKKIIFFYLKILQTCKYYLCSHMNTFVMISGLS